ncbi:MAG: hypothetical protein RR619_01465, partial [Raoultibacter sp.]
GDRDTSQQKKKLEGFIAILGCLKSFCDRNEGLVAFDFILSSTQSFKSGFCDGALEEALVYFPHFREGQQHKKLGEIMAMPSGDPLQKDIRTFYLYYRREEDNQPADAFSLEISALASDLGTVIGELPDFALL